jgi:glucose-6-phosphate 1-dehydrogenase
MKNNTAPLSFVLFGATGDLAQKKIMPALFALFQKNRLPRPFRVIAYSRRPWKDEEYRKFIKPSLRQHEIRTRELEHFLEHVIYAEGTFDDEKSFNNLKNKLQELDDHVFIHSEQQSEKIYHLAIQPVFYEQVINRLAKAGLAMTDELSEPKIMIEKPIGRDLASAQNLEMLMASHFSEKQKFRIDHYLGKEAIQAIMAERRSDTELDYKLNNHYVESIHVRLLEKIDVGDRGEFYDETGAIRDVGQNHLLEMLAMATAEVPRIATAEQTAHARGMILKALRPIDAELGQLVRRGQYDGYRETEGVNPKSMTETYFKIQTEIQTPRWKGVPIILEAGKALANKAADMTIRFKDDSVKLFFAERPAFLKVPDAYELLIEKAIEGDKTLFVSSEEIIASWKFIESAMKYLKKAPLFVYEKGEALDLK